MELSVALLQPMGTSPLQLRVGIMLPGRATFREASLTRRSRWSMYMSETLSSVKRTRRRLSLMPLLRRVVLSDSIFLITGQALRRVDGLRSSSPPPLTTVKERPWSTLPSQRTTTRAIPFLSSGILRVMQWGSQASSSAFTPPTSTLRSSIREEGKALPMILAVWPELTSIGSRAVITGTGFGKVFSSPQPGASQKAAPSTTKKDMRFRIPLILLCSCRRCRFRDRHSARRPRICP